VTMNEAHRSRESTQLAAERPIAISELRPTHGATEDADVLGNRSFSS
jgi:hypothetical protein